MDSIVSATIEQTFGITSITQAIIESIAGFGCHNKECQTWITINPTLASCVNQEKKRENKEQIYL
jgi:hypothetical protein